MVEQPGPSSAMDARSKGDESSEELRDNETFVFASPTYEEPKDTFVVEQEDMDHGDPTVQLERPAQEKYRAEARSLERERQRELHKLRTAMHARVNRYFFSAPDVIVRSPDRLAEMIDECSMRPETLVRDYAVLTGEYDRFIAFTKQLFPRDTGLQAISRDAVIAASPKRLEQIETQWSIALRRADGVGWGEGESSFERLAAHAGVLAEGIRNLREVAERLRVDLQPTQDALPMETTEERFGTAAK